MKRAKKRTTWCDALVFSPSNQRKDVRRYYLEYRREKDIPVRCDNALCMFHAEPLEWNGKRLDLILDHRNGVRGDNRPKNLWFLCPNCDSQQLTRGGRNKNRVQTFYGGHSVVQGDGSVAVTIITMVPGSIEYSGRRGRVDNPEEA